MPAVITFEMVCSELTNLLLLLIHYVSKTEKSDLYTLLFTLFKINKLKYSRKVAKNVYKNILLKTNVIVKVSLYLLNK